MASLLLRIDARRRALMTRFLPALDTLRVLNVHQTARQSASSTSRD